MTARNDHGNALGILSIILTAIIIGVVGYVAVINLTASETTTMTTKEQSTQRADGAADEEMSTRTYESATYTFEYPSTGWVVSSPANNDNYFANLTIQTDDYKPNVGMGVDTGAILAVSIDKVADTRLEERINQLKSDSYTKDIRPVTTKTGLKGYSYIIQYEGTHYRTEFEDAAGAPYTIAYNEADGQSGDRSTYEKIVASFALR